MRKHSPVSIVFAAAIIFVFSRGSAFAAAAPLTLDYPRGGESFVIGTTQVIRLGAKKTKIASITIELSRNGGKDWTTVGTITPNKGVAAPFDFPVTGPASDSCIIQVSGKLGKIDASAKTVLFSIRAPDPAPDTGSGFIQNQTTAPQVAGFNISGNGLVGGSVKIGGGGTPNSALQVAGAISEKLTVVNNLNSLTLDSTHCNVVINNAVNFGQVSYIFLPSAAGLAGRRYTLIISAFNTVQIHTSSSEEISNLGDLQDRDPGTNAVIPGQYSLSYPFNVPVPSISLISDGTTWWAYNLVY